VLVIRLEPLSADSEKVPVEELEVRLTTVSVLIDAGTAVPEETSCSWIVIASVGVELTGPETAALVNAT